MLKVWGFFYGGLINPDVMKKLGMAPERSEVGTLPGFSLQISPLVNLVPDTRDLAYGLLLYLSHAELDAVYGQLAARYVPIPVAAYDSDGKIRPAMCYVVPEMKPGPAEAAHVLNLLRPAEKLAFPEWYLERIRSFLPPST